MIITCNLNKVKHNGAMLRNSSVATGTKRGHRCVTRRVSKKPEIINSGILKGCYPFSGFQRQSLWQVAGQSPAIRSAQQRVNFKTVRWTVLKEGTPCKRGRSLMDLYFFDKKKGTQMCPPIIHIKLLSDHAGGLFFA